MFSYGKKGFLSRGHGAVLASASMLLFITNCLSAVDKARSPLGAGYEILPLKYVSVEQGKKCLTKVLTGTITYFPGSSALLVTARPSELAKAKALLDLVDGPDRFIIKAIRRIPVDGNAPSSRRIVAKVSRRLTRGISIGSFSDPPPADASVRAIVDTHNDSVIAVAPVGWMGRIVSAVRQLTNSYGPKKPEEMKGPYGVEGPATQNISERTTPNEARFLLAANNKMKTEPNATATSPEHKTLKLAAASQSHKLPPPANGEQIVDLALDQRQSLTIIEFLGLVGPYLQLDFLYKERDVNQEITIDAYGKFAGPMKVKDLYPLLESVLKFKNLAMTRGKGNLVTIVPVADALTIDPALDPALLDTYREEFERGDGAVTSVFELEHVDTASAINLLTSMQLTIAPPIPKGEAIIVTGYAHRMARIQALLDIIDEPGERKEFRFRQLRYTLAETLAPKLQALAEKLGTLSITVTAQRTTPPTPPARPQRRRGESTAAYSARVRQWTRARQRWTTTTRQRTSAQQPEPTRPTAHIEADETSNRILMIGFDEQLDAIEELIDTLDVAQQEFRTLKLYNVEHVSAEEARRKLEELGIVNPGRMTPYSPRMTSAGKSPTTRYYRAPSKTQASNATVETLAEEPQVIVVEQTNSLLVNATAEQHEKIVRVLNYVDSEILDSDIPVQLYPLQNQSPEHLAGVLEKLIQDTFADKEGKIERIAERPDEEMPIIVPEPNTFSLIVYASKKNQEWISNIIENLDKRRPQVLIDVTLVEISESDVFDYDLKLVSKFPRFPADGGGDMEVLPDLYVAPEDSGFPSNSITEFGSFTGGILGGQGFYGDSHIQALLTLMQEKGYGRVLAKPKILVNDNEVGHIDSTTTIYVSRSASTATTTGEPVVSSSFTFDEFPSGIILDITPHISKGDLLRLEIDVTRSSQQPPASSAENVPPEPRIENNISTTVTVPDKSTIILGGIVQLDQVKKTWKVPVLGDIPLVGGLFRKIGNSSSDTRLYIFVKAEILTPDDALAGLADLQKISEGNRAAFEEFEEKFQNHQDWPGVKPKPVEPLRVLDTQ